MILIKLTTRRNSNVLYSLSSSLSLQMRTVNIVTSAILMKIVVRHSSARYNFIQLLPYSITMRGVKWKWSRWINGPHNDEISPALMQERDFVDVVTREFYPGIDALVSVIPKHQRYIRRVFVRSDGSKASSTSL